MESVAVEMYRVPQENCVYDWKSYEGGMIGKMIKEAVFLSSSAGEIKSAKRLACVCA